jgi:hypothetical protein
MFVNTKLPIAEPLALDRGRLWTGLAISGLTGALGAPAPFPKDLIRLGPLDYSGLRGEGSIPVALPPPEINISN